MRIVGGKDYYDSGLQYGVDTETVFVRTGFLLPANGVALPRVYEVGVGLQAASIPPPRSIWSSHRPVTWTHGSLEYRLECVAVLLCDRLYKGVRVFWSAEGAGARSLEAFEKSGGTPKIRGSYTRTRQETFWDRNSLAKFLAKRGASLKPITRKKTPRGTRVEANPFERRVLTPEEISAVVEAGVAVATWCHEEHTVEVKVGGRARKEQAWLCNSDSLKDYDFIKVLDPVQAFQRISMWVGGVLPKPGAQMVQITDDKVKLAKHGMDHTSFRKPKENAR